MAIDDAFTIALLHLNGVDTSTTFTDEAGNTWTARGNAQLDTAQKKFGTASLLLDGAGDSADTPDNAKWAFAGDFTIDCQIRLNALPGEGANFPICGQYVDATHYWLFYVTKSAGVYYLGLYGVPAPASFAVITPSTNTWYHVAVVRSGNNIIIFLDGSSIATATDATAFPNIAAVMEIGKSSASYFNGWIDELRISTVPRWTSGFTPPEIEYEPAAGQFIIWSSE
jgi:hypothetical protein